MSGRPLQLGPDPNRSYLERWNEMHPDRYGRADTFAESDDAGPQWDAEGGAADPGTGSLLETLLSLAILVLAPLVGATTTILLYQWTRPDQLTSGSVLGYAAAFLGCTFAAAVLIYVVRHLLLGAAFLTLTLGIGYFGWNLIAG